MKELMVCDWFTEAQSHYKNVFSDERMYMDDSEKQRLKKYVLKRYQAYNRIPSVSELLWDIYEYNFDETYAGFLIEVENNPEFKNTKAQLQNNKDQADELLCDNVSAILSTIDMQEIYDEILVILHDYKLMCIIFDIDDTYSNLYLINQALGEDIKFVLNDSQNILIKSFKKLPEDVMDGMPVASENWNIISDTDKEVDKIIRLEAAR